jgi:hypothetical protein
VLMVFRHSLRNLAFSPDGKAIQNRESGPEMAQTDFCEGNQNKQANHLHVDSLLFRKWCQRADLNRRPKAYESSALPLSYTGTPF